MPPQYTPHQKLSLRKHPVLNEPWLHDRICDDPSMLGLGDVRVLDRERTLTGGGRLDLILLDDENDRRYEVEIQLGATDPSHIIRALFWQGANTGIWSAAATRPTSTWRSSSPRTSQRGSST